MYQQNHCKAKEGKASNQGSGKTDPVWLTMTITLYMGESYLQRCPSHLQRRDGGGREGILKSADQVVSRQPGKLALLLTWHCRSG